MLVPGENYNFPLRLPLFFNFISYLSLTFILIPVLAPVLDDSDVFQCGRCKKQFSSIDVFVNHKTECNNSVNQVSDISLPANVSGIPQNTVVLQKIQVRITFIYT